MYKIITLKELRPKLPKVMENIDKELERYVVSKRGKPVVIMLGLDDFESLIETLNETADRDNLIKLKKAMKEAKVGKTVDWKSLKEKLGFAT